MPICIKCGSQNPTEAEYCFKCGAVLYKGTSDELNTINTMEPSPQRLPESDSGHKDDKYRVISHVGCKRVVVSDEALYKTTMVYYLIASIVALGTLYLLFCFKMEVQSTEFLHLLKGELTVNDFFTEFDSQFMVIIATIFALASIFIGTSFIGIIMASLPMLVAMFNDNIIPKLDMEMTNVDTFMFIFIVLIVLSIVQLYLYNESQRKMKAIENQKI